MRGSNSHLIVAFLSFSLLIFSINAVPITRTRNLMLESQGYGVSDIRKLVAERTERRVEIELNDYPGAGSNNRHSPNPKRACIDC